MTRKISDVMTPKPCVLDHRETVVEAARIMRDRHIGGVVVTDGDRYAES